MSESTTDGEPRVDDENQRGATEPSGAEEAAAGDGEPHHEPGTPHTKVGRFMRTMGHLRSVYGPAAHRDLSEPEPHTRNPEDVKETHELEGIDVQTDSEGHHYGVRREPENTPREE